MKLLFDANLSPRIAAALRSAGFEAIYVDDVGLATAEDDVILAHAVEHRMAIVTADSDFAQMLALSGADTPSVVQMRHIAELSPDEHTDLLVANLPALMPELENGVIASLSPGRLRVRGLPIR